MSQLKSDIKKLRFLHISVTASLVAFSAVAYMFVSGQKNAAPVALNAKFELLFLAIIALLSVAGYLLFKKKHKKSLMQPDFESKFKTLRIGFIIHYAFVEGATIFSLVIYIMFAIQNFILFSLLLIVYLVYLRPNDEKLLNYLDIDDADKSLIK